MKMIKLSRMLVVALIIGLCAIGCGQEISHKTCDYCEGEIYSHRVEAGGFSDKWKLQYKTADGKHYHSWCAKMREEE